MNPIDEVVKQLERLNGMKQGYSHATINLMDLTDWLCKLPITLAQAYDAQKELSDMQEFRKDIEARLAQQEHNCELDKGIEMVFSTK